MSHANWRVPNTYEGLRSLDAPGFAWQFLRRNSDFLRERARLRQSARQGHLDPAEVEAFTRRWGVRFHDQASDPDPEPDRLDARSPAQPRLYHKLAA